MKRWTHWTTDEIALLRELMAAGKTYRQAGRALDRTHAAVKYKCEHLDIPYTAEIGWPAADKLRLCELIESGLTYPEAAKALGRTLLSVKQAGYWMGLRPGHKRQWTDEQVRILDAGYGKKPARALAEEIGKPVSVVYRMAYKRGLMVRPKPEPFTQVEIDRIRELNAAGVPDTHIALELGRDRHETSKHRKRLCLPSNARGQVWRERVAAGVKRQCDLAGVKNLAEFRWESYRNFARKYNLPDTLGPRAVQIVLALAQHGPMTLKQIAEATGMRLRQRGSASGIICALDNSAGTTYFSTLRKLGLVAYVFRHEGARRVPGQYVLTAAALDRLAAAIGGNR